MSTKFRPPISSGTWISVAVHGFAVLLLVLAVRLKTTSIEPLRLPGISSGQEISVVFNPGGAAQSAASAVPRRTQPRLPRQPRPQPAPVKTPPAAPSELSEKGLGLSGESSAGEGNINIALVQNHPRPEPDLSSLPHGTGGDVVVDVLIDAQGHITQLTLMHGLGQPIDNAVLATLRSWTYTPATRDGQAIASEQEILLHYEHG